jgi:RHS repeat-associated protein
MRILTCLSLALSLSAALVHSQDNSNAGAGTGASDAQPTNGAVNVGQTPVIDPVKGVLVGQDANRRVWNRAVAFTNADQKVTYRTNTTVEMASGARYKDAQGLWQPSQETIKLTPNGAAAATNGYHKAFFEADVAAGGTDGSVHIISGDGKHLRSRFLGIAYHDFHLTESNTVLIAELTNSIGVIAGNTVCYSNATTDFRTDIRYTYRKEKIEQDILIREVPNALPEDFGLNPATTRLEIWTEFFDPPTPVVDTKIRRGWKKDTVARTISFGEMIIGQGFSGSLSETNGARKGVPVEKQWVVVPGENGAPTRYFLCEEIPWRWVVPGLRNLQKSTQHASTKPAPGSVRHVVSNRRLLPQMRVAENKPGAASKMTIAKTMSQDPAFLIDYPMVTSTSDFQFTNHCIFEVASNSTTYLSGTTKIMGGCVIRYEPGAVLEIDGPVECHTGPYEPAILTSVEDTSVASASLGAEPAGTSAAVALQLNYEADLKYLFIRYADIAISSAFDYTLSHSQITHCGMGIQTEYTTFLARNCLFHDVGTNICGSFFHGTGENLTIQQGDTVTDDPEFSTTLDMICDVIPSSSITLVNSFIAEVAVDGIVPISADHTVHGDGSWFFHKVGGAGFYLLHASNFVGSGSASLSPGLLAELRSKTIYPPQVYASTHLTNSIILNPVVPRDAGLTPTPGYHYDCIDWAFGAVEITNAINITVNPGTVVGGFGTNGWAHGIALNNGAQLSVLGTAANPVRMVEYNTVQENGFAGWNNLSFSLISDDLGAGGGSGPATSFGFDFAHFYAIGADDGSLVAYATPVTLRNSEFHGSQFVIYTNCAITNCLFEYVQGTISDPSGSEQIFLQNCLFYQGIWQVMRNMPSTWMFRDSLFDHVDITCEDPFNEGYSGYVTGSSNLVTTSGTDVTTNLVWQSGPLGDFYQPTNSGFINKGSMNSTSLGLSLFTTQTNQTDEASSTVDLGYHYASIHTPMIGTNPVSLTKIAGTDANFSVAVTNTFVVNYQWQQNGSDIPGATSSAYMRTNVQYLADHGSYTVVCSNTAGAVTSSIATLTILVPPVFTVVPASTNIVQGNDVTLVAAVTNVATAPVSFQWQLNGTDIADATTASLTLHVPQPTDSGIYTIIATNIVGSNAVSATVGIYEPIRITNEPQSVIVVQGANAPFQVGASGTSPVYTWRRAGTNLSNGGNISGASTNTLIVSSVTTADATNYSVVVTNPVSAITSSVASLTVITPPVITSFNISPFPVIQAADATFTVTATSATTPIYQWTYNGTSITGANSSSYTNLVMTTNNNGLYSIIVSNDAGSVTNSTNITILIPPTITSQPTDTITNVGSNATFTVTATGSATLSYFWFLSDTNFVLWETNFLSTLTFTNVQTSNAGSYSVTVSNSIGTNRSILATLFVTNDVCPDCLGSGGATNPAWLPTITMTQPTNAAASNPSNYVHGLPIALHASCTTTDRTAYITSVAFYGGRNLNLSDSNFLGVAVAGPNSTYAWRFDAPPHGTNWFVAVASDSKSRTNSSQVVYALMDDAPTNTASSTSVTMVWEGYTTNLWVTNTISDDGLPYSQTNLSIVNSSGITIDSQATNWTSSNVVISAHLSFTNYGSYSRTVTTDDGYLTNAVATSIRIQHRPVVTITTPTNLSEFVIGTVVELRAGADDPDGVVQSVTFYHGSTAIGNAPWSGGTNYALGWTPAPGAYSVTAVATDNDGLSATSAPVVITVWPHIDVSFLSPTNNQLYVFSPTNVLMLVAVTSHIGPVSVDSVTLSNNFTNFGNATPLSNDIYSGLWQYATNGTYTLFVHAHDVSGDTASNSVTVNLNALPQVGITNPPSLIGGGITTYTGVTSVTICATNFDRDGFVTNVQFYCGSTHFSPSVSNAGYWSFTSNFPPATYAVTAIASDNEGASSASAIRVFKVVPTNPPPTVYITYPTSGSTLPAGASITITADATNWPASVTNVEFFANSQSLGSDTNAPYSVTVCCWKPGSYDIVAVARDTYGAVGVSTQVNISVLESLPTGPGFWDPAFTLPDPTLQARAIATYGSNLYSSVYYDPEVLKWDGEAWSYLGEDELGYDVSILAMAADQSGLYYASIDDNWISVYKYDGTNAQNLAAADALLLTWDYVDEALQLTVPPKWVSLKFIGPDLYLAGEVALNGTITNCLLRYDPAVDSWGPVGSAFDGPVYAVDSYDGDLVVGGRFQTNGASTNLHCLARFRSGAWASIGDGVEGANSSSGRSAVYTLAGCGANLFAGGDFKSAGQDADANGVAVWNGQIWSAVGSGVSGPGTDVTPYAMPDPVVFSLAARGNTLYVAGQFTGISGLEPGGTLVSGIAKAEWSEDQQQWVWSDMDLGIFYGASSEAPGTFDGYVPLTALVEGAQTGSYDVIAAGSFQFAGASMTNSTSPYYAGLARWRVGQSLATNVPSLSIISPTNYALFTNSPSSLEIVATNTGALSFEAVEFYVDGDFIGTDSTSDTNAYRQTWSSLANGIHLLKVVATGTNGIRGESKPVLVSLKNPANAVVARDDAFSIIESSPAVSLQLLTNDTPGSGLRISSLLQLHGSLGTATLGHDGSYITYTPFPNFFGTDHFAYTVTNSSGASDSAWVTVNIKAKPRVQITSAPLYSGTTSNVVISGAAIDYDGTVTNVSLLVDGALAAQTISTNFSFNWNSNIPAFYTIAAAATDNDGLTNVSLPVTVVLTNSSTVTNIITASISNLPPDSDGLGGTIAPVVRDGVFALLGQARDSNTNDPVAYQLQLVRPEDNPGWDPNNPDSDHPVLFANVTPTPRDTAGFHQGGDITNYLGQLDLSGIPNGTYFLLLTVHGGAGEATDTKRFRLDSNLKIGQFSFSEQDLSLPVNGIPLTVTRTYNSLNPLSSDFGYSWSFALNSMDVQLDDERTTVTVGQNAITYDGDDEDDNGLPKQVNIRTGGGWDVTLTLPDGRRTTFAFSADGIWPQLLAKWTPPPDVHATLEMKGNAEIVLDAAGGLSGLTWGDSGSGIGSAPLENQDIQGWVLTTQDGTKYNITRGPAQNVAWDKNGDGNAVNVRAYGPPKLTSIVQRTGDTITISDDAVSHFAPGASIPTRSIFFTRDVQGRITELRDPISGSNGPPVVKYVYNRDTGNLIQVLRLVDRTVGTCVTNKYHYDNPNFPHYITSIENASGVPLVRNLYDDSGRLVGIIDALGHTNSFVHDPAGRVETVYDRKGVPTTFAYDSRGNVTNSIDAYGATNSFSYDDNGAMTSHTDPLGRTTTYTNDTLGNVLSVTLPYPLGANPLLYTTRATYDTNGNQTSVLLPSGGLVTNIFDNVGNLLETRDGGGNLISRTDYDPANSLPIAEGDRFGTNFFAYDAAGNSVFFTNSLHQVISSGYDNNGQLAAMTNNGVASTFNYDALGRETVSDFGQGITLSNTFNADQDWSVVDAPTVGHMERNFDEQNRLAGWKTVNGATPGYTYDDNGRMQFETNSVGAISSYTYDLVGRVSSTTNLATGAWNAYTYDLAGQRVADTNTLGQVTSFDYWPDGSLKAMTNATGTNVWFYSDSGSACSSCSTLTTNTVTDPLGRIAMDVRNENGLPMQTIFMSGTNVLSNTTAYLTGMDSPDQEAADYPASVTDEGGRTRTYTYTDLGQLLTATDLGGNTWTNQYHLDSGALTNVLSPTGESLSYTYDSLDNVKTIRFGDGHYLTNFYDDANRLSSNALPGGAIVSMLYDQAGRLTNRASGIGETASFAYNLNDAVTTMTDNTGSTTNLHDAAGRLWGIDYPSGASVRYELDLLGRITGITNKASSSGTAYVTKYGYDEIGNIKTVTDPFNGVTSLEYDRVGRRTKRAFPNGVVTTWDYDWRDRVTNIVHKVGSTVLASVIYVRANGGEPTRITREDGTYVVLGYDAALRLTSEAYYNASAVLQTTNGYGYDSSGNRVLLARSGTILTNSVSAGYHITAVKNGASTVETYAYDDGGRVTTITRDSATLNLGYNASDQVTALTNGSSWVTYSHDANGRRTVSTNSAGTVRRLLVAPTPGSDLESPHVIADATGALQQGYVYLGYSPLARYSTSGAAAYYLEDGMGSVIGYAPASSPTTANTTTLFYDGFGNTRLTNGPAPAFATGTGGDFRFQGSWFETASGLYNMRAREYDPQLGRFTSRDPRDGVSRRPETLNPYIYAANNAYVFTDPSGECTTIEISVEGLIDTVLEGMQNAVIYKAKQYLKDSIYQAVSSVVVNELGNLYPPLGDVWKALKDGKFAKAGRNFEQAFKEKICGTIGADGPLTKLLWFYPGINASGDAESPGLNCPNLKTPSLKAGLSYPDFVISEGDPTKSAEQKAVTIGDVKLSGNSLYKQYCSPGDSKQQFGAIARYASRNTLSHTAVFLTVFTGQKSKLMQVRALLELQGVERGTVVVVIAALKNKNFNDIGQ